MKKEKPLILLSNDDGVEAKGLNELIRGLRGMGEIIVMAPDGPRSGASGAITSEHPVKYYKVREEEDLTVYKMYGHTGRLCETGIAYGGSPSSRCGDRWNKSR